MRPTLWLVLWSVPAWALPPDDKDHRAAVSALGVPPDVVAAVTEAIGRSRRVVPIPVGVVEEVRRRLRYTPEELCRLDELEPERLAVLAADRALPWDFVLCPQIEPIGGRKEKTWTLLLVDVALGRGQRRPEQIGRTGTCKEDCAARLGDAAQQLLDGHPYPPPALRAHAESQPPPALGHLTVISDPPGAMVRIANVFMGTTPARFALAADMDWPLEVELKALGPARHQTVRVAEGADQQVMVRLDAQLVTAHISTDPPGAMVYVDGRLLGKTPLIWRDFIGFHEVRLLLPGYLGLTDRVRVVEGTRLHRALVPEHRGLMVINEGAPRHLQVNGVYHGVLRTGEERRLPQYGAGEVKVCIHHQRGFREPRCTVRVLPGPPVVFTELSPPFEPDLQPIVHPPDNILGPAAPAPPAPGVGWKAGAGVGAATAALGIWLLADASYEARDTRNELRRGETSEVQDHAVQVEADRDRLVGSAIGAVGLGVLVTCIWQLLED